VNLAPGTTLLHYRLAGKIGEGGMGVVWRATDTTLGREVAIKVIPADLATDAERLARFEREARLLASLNHPNIAAVYGFHDAGGTIFLAMELVPGEDLAARLRRGTIPAAEAIPLARSIAGALEYAHEHGIVHRDLKPANVTMTPEGQVKVLDFGLAKATGGPGLGSGPGQSPTMMPTVTSAGSAAGIILGTAAYMSPEQARGKAVDRRTDIWAFGCVLYEMLTGRRAFDGETVTDVLAAVVSREPDWDALPAATPRAIRALLARCLDKDARMRLRDIGEARVVLEAASEAAAEVHGDDAAREGAPGVAAWRGRRAERLAWLLAVVLLAGGWALWGGLFGGRGGSAAPGASAAGDVIRPYTLRRLTELPGLEGHPDLSPDGRMLIYDSAAGGSLDIYLLRVGGGRAINLTAGSPADDDEAAFSPDGNAIAFRSGRDGGGLFVMGATGESVRRVTSAGYDPAWSPDGKTLAYTTEPVNEPYNREGNSELWSVAIGTGETRRLFAGDAVQAAWSPDGGFIAYWANNGGQRDVWVVPATGGDPVAVTSDPATDWSPDWSPDGRWLFFSSDRGGSMGLWRVGIDPATGRPAGPPQPVSTGMRSLGFARPAAAGERMAVMAYDRTWDLRLYAVDPERPEAPRPGVLLRNQAIGRCGPSPDGVWLACSSQGVGEDLVLVRADGGEVRRLMDDPFKDRVPLWSPDGQSITFYSTRGGHWDYWTIRADGSDLRRLTDINDAWGGILAPDGRRLLLSLNAGAELLLGDAASVSTLDTVRRLAPAVPPGTGFNPYAWTAVGDRVVGVLQDKIGAAVALATYGMEDGVLRRYDIPMNGAGFRAVGGWMPDGRRVVVRADPGIVLLDTGTGTWKVLLPAEPTDGIALSRDGRTLLVEKEIVDGDIWLVDFEAGAP